VYLKILPALPNSVKGDASKCQKLLDKGWVLSMVDDAGMTPLHTAAMKGNASIVSLFVRRQGCPMNVETQNGKTALDLAAQGGHLTCIEVLLRYGAGLLSPRRSEDGCACKSLLIATLGGYKNVCQVLLATLSQKLGAALPAMALPADVMEILQRWQLIQIEGVRWRLCDGVASSFTTAIASPTPAATQSWAERQERWARVQSQHPQLGEVWASKSSGGFTSAAAAGSAWAPVEVDQFLSLTSTSSRTEAAKMLQMHGGNVEQAVNGFFDTSSPERRAKKTAEKLLAKERREWARKPLMATVPKRTAEKVLVGNGARWTSAAGNGAATVAIATQQRQVLLFKFEDLAVATNNFDKRPLQEGGRKIGGGGFGVVIQGFLTLQNQALSAAAVAGTREADRKVIAVKRLTQDVSIGEQAGLSAISQFRAELGLLKRANHKNIVSLLGYCQPASFNGDSPLNSSCCIALEYCELGSLDQHLAVAGQLAWGDRMTVADDIAQGLNYLHSHLKMIHRDMACANILLKGMPGVGGENSNAITAKISDFGLSVTAIPPACVTAGVGSSYCTDIVGTLQYLAPEYQNSGLLTTAADVYAFGVVLLELISNVSEGGHTSGNKLRQIVASVDQLGNSVAAADAAIPYFHQLKRVVSQCVRRSHVERPSSKSLVLTVSSLTSQFHQNEVRALPATATPAVSSSGRASSAISNSNATVDFMSFEDASPKGTSISEKQLSSLPEPPSSASATDLWNNNVQSNIVSTTTNYGSSSMATAAVPSIFDSPFLPDPPFFSPGVNNNAGPAQQQQLQQPQHSFGSPAVRQQQGCPHQPQHQQPFSGLPIAGQDANNYQPMQPQMSMEALLPSAPLNNRSIVHINQQAQAPMPNQNLQPPVGGLASLNISNNTTASYPASIITNNGKNVNSTSGSLIDDLSMIDFSCPTGM
jgi:hypothetical protein